MAIMKDDKSYISTTTTLNSTQQNFLQKMKKILLQKSLESFYMLNTYRGTEAMA